MSTLLIKDASYIVTMDESQPLLRDASIFIRDGQIEAIGEGLWTQADEVVAAKGRIVYPGLVNTHHHLYQVLTRNLPRVQRMELGVPLLHGCLSWQRLHKNSHSITIRRRMSFLLLFLGYPGYLPR
ncbi:MAG: 8-oxoguanine deaminase, partial [Firmicutes bacterium]|nr:8-oxoguanine deaminase [Bacillota bacterium]